MCELQCVSPHCTRSCSQVVRSLHTLSIVVRPPSAFLTCLVPHPSQQLRLFSNQLPVVQISSSYSSDNPPKHAQRGANWISVARLREGVLNYRPPSFPLAPFWIQPAFVYSISLRMTQSSRISTAIQSTAGWLVWCFNAVLVIAVCFCCFIFCSNTWSLLHNRFRL